MSWRRQNVLSVAAIALLVALNTLLPASDSPVKGTGTIVAANHR